MANQIKAGVVLTYLTLFFNSVIGLLYTPLLTSKLGQAEYGLYALATSVVGSLTILDFGFGNALVRYTAKFRAEKNEQKLKELFGMFFVIFCVIALVALIIGSVLYFNTSALFSRSMTSAEVEKTETLVLLMVFNLCFTFVMSVFHSIVVAYERFVFQKVVNLIRIVLNPLVMVVFLFLGYKSVCLVVTHTLFNVLTLCADFLYCRRKLKVRFSFARFDTALLKEISLYSLWIFLNAIMDKVYWSLGQGVTGVYCGAKMVAVYGIAIQLQQMYMSFSTAISGVLLPRITSMVTVEANDKAVSDLFIRTGRLQFCVMGLVLSGFAVFGRAFINLWVGESYAQSYYICLMFFVPLLVPLIQNVGICILQARNRMRFRSLSYLVISLVSLVVSLPLTKRYGIMATALCTSAALVLGQIVLMNVYYKKVMHLDIPAFWKEIIKMSVAPIAFTLVAFKAMDYVLIENYLQLGLYALVFCVVYFTVFWFCSMNSYEKGLVSGFCRKVTRKH